MSPAWTWTLGLLGAGLLYLLIPHVSGRHLPGRVVRRGPEAAKAVALTFDDGPDPRSTPRVMAVLERYGARATFFVVGRRVLAHPELVREAVKAGHEVGNHGHRHKHAWTLGPWATGREVRQAGDAIRMTTGRPPSFFRPPWGGFNLFTTAAAHRERATVVLWSAAPRDWDGRQDPEAIAREALEGARPGAIIDLHDGGGAPGAPERTVAALPLILEGLAERGLRAVTLSELLGGKGEGSPLGWRVLRRAWNVWERLFARLFRLWAVPAAGDETVRIRFERHRGEPVAFDDGTRIDPGDWVGELHLSSVAVDRGRSAGTGRSELAATFDTARRLRRFLGGLAVELERGGVPYPIRAVYGRTLLWRGARRMGFEVRDVPRSLGNRWLQAYMRWLMVLYHPRGGERLKDGSEPLEMKEIWFPTAALRMRYGPGGGDGREAVATRERRSP
ncbi:polysaccharide deacetylase family protein [Limnochorda pilosa]|uniref:Polysaccharide deacetylase n=1 Tax=Limnochorda pilosa TaxID=1555112 RepID=A0A0K2SNY2_LIMPI|nr:polysaccharide deacetylase family protein [Limnochorda pilosa]BAS28539.1 polysaccharide deacetylase [Limnochorda pilosa]